MSRVFQLLALGGVVSVLQEAGASQIAFDSDREGAPDIYVVNADGGRASRMTSNAGGAIAPAWSPLADRIAHAGAMASPDRAPDISLLSIFAKGAIT
jgi:TolB protein